MTTIIWRHIKIGMLLFMLSAISACGQKGDLYLPPEEVTMHDFPNPVFV